MADKDVEVGGKVIGESTKISLSVKNALWIIGVVITFFSSVFTIAYFDVKDEVKTYKERLDSEQAAFVKNVEESITNKLDKRRDKDESFIKDIEEIRGNIRLLLDRTQGSRTAPTNSNPTINTNTPTSTTPPPNREH